MSAADVDLRSKLRQAERNLRDLRRLLDRAGHWIPDEDVIDQLRALEGLTLLARQCYREGRGLDRWAQNLWLWEHPQPRFQTGCPGQDSNLRPAA
jgi:hypothetical protein